MRRIKFFKVHITGVDIPSSFFIDGSCFEDLNNALSYVNDCWKNFSCSRFLNRDGRKVINDYEFTRDKPFHYTRQFTVVGDSLFARIVTLSVYESCLILK